MSENDVIELKKELREARSEISDLKSQISGLESKVDLLISGKIKTDDKPLMTAMDIIKAALLALIGAISGFIAGKG